MAQVHPTTPETRPIIASIDIADRVRDITARVLGIAPDRVVEAADFVRDLGASSLDLVELIMAVEDAFGIEISDSAAERITTVSDLQAFIRSQVPAGRTPAQA
ncbi:MAG: acyl carrier protein [Reyranella sp.]|nr:acyl carrier protein [Reyranella sp.]MDP3162296.1 acyl carrier protein [Reyranella sp.]